MPESENELHLVFTVNQKTIDTLETLARISGIEKGEESAGLLLIYALRIYQDLLIAQLAGRTVAFLDSAQLKQLIDTNNAPIWWTNLIEPGQEDLAKEYFREERSSETGENSDNNVEEAEKIVLSQNVMEDISKLLEGFS